MIQRIQTLYLLAAAILSALAAFVLPMLSHEGAAISANYSTYVFAGYGMAMASFSGAILFYTNRGMQLFLVRLGMFDNLMILGGMIFALKELEGATASWGAVVPFLSILLAFLASKGIRADQKKVSSYDRLR